MIAFNISPLDSKEMELARMCVDTLVKPMGSLGLLEEYAVKMAGIRGYTGGSLDKKGVLIFAADNGIHAQNITTVPQSVTVAQSLNIARGIAGVSVLAKQQGADVFLYNVGALEDIVSDDIDEERVKNVSVMRGTNDITQGPAMSRKQCEDAIRAGFEAVERHREYDVLGIGEMGICNSATAAAVSSVLLEEPVKALTGRGTGLSDEYYSRKIKALERAIEVNQPNPNDVADVLAKVGGLDIAAMTGAFISCAHYGIPAVVDGFISICAALCAVRLAPLAIDYIFPSHRSYELGYLRVAGSIGLRPAFDMHMRLGEGSGCPLMFNILEASLRMISDMGTFGDGKIDPANFVDMRVE